MRRFVLFAAVTLIGMLTETLPAHAQNSRLFDKPLPMAPRPGPFGPRPETLGPPYAATIDSTSWITVPTPPMREIRPNDIVTIRVDIAQRTLAGGDFQRRKNANFDSLLRNWVTLEGLSQIRPAPQSEGDQRIQGTLNKQDRVTSELETTESLKFEIAATVAAVLPNGNVVLEAHRRVTNNEETWLQSLTGVCPREAIGPGNVVLSKDIAQLEIRKEELGSIKDSYKRGWLLRAWDLVKLF